MAGASKGEKQGGGQGDIVTAAVLVIGDEILSGRTKDKNIGFIAEHMTAIGIDLKEVRVVPDEEPEIVAALNALRARYTYVFTTGGIGPTHDDITADAVAKAFGLPIDHDPRAVALLRERLAVTGGEMNEARLRMTRMPKGAELVLNKISAAPGFHDRQCHCHGRHSAGDAGDARIRDAEAQDRDRYAVGDRTRRLPRGRYRHRARRHCESAR